MKRSLPQAGQIACVVESLPNMLEVLALIPSTTYIRHGDLNLYNSLGTEWIELGESEVHGPSCVPTLVCPTQEDTVSQTRSFGW